MSMPRSEQLELWQRVRVKILRKEVLTDNEVADLRQGDTINYQSKDDANRSLLDCAIEHATGNPELLDQYVNLLLKWGANPALPSDHHQLALHCLLESLIMKHSLQVATHADAFLRLYFYTDSAQAKKPSAHGLRPALFAEDIELNNEENYRKIRAESLSQRINQMAFYGIRLIKPVSADAAPTPSAPPETPATTDPALPSPRNSWGNASPTTGSQDPDPTP